MLMIDIIWKILTYSLKNYHAFVEQKRNWNKMWWWYICTYLKVSKQISSLFGNCIMMIANWMHTVAVNLRQNNSVQHIIQINKHSLPTYQTIMRENAFASLFAYPYWLSISAIIKLNSLLELRGDGWQCVFMSIWNIAIKRREENKKKKIRFCNDI